MGFIPGPNQVNRRSDMKNTAHYQGLTEKQVLENRDKYCVNI